MTEKNERRRVAVLVSGRGSNMLALADAAGNADYPAEIAAVLSDRADAGGLDAARQRGIAAFAIERKEFSDRAAHEAAMLSALTKIAPDILCLAGYMRLLSPAFIARYRDRIVNIHPSLLPLFPGLDTHVRALQAGVRLHGCTVHFVNEGMDEGAIIAQAAVPVLSGDTATTLAARVLKAEHRLYPHALAMVARGEVRLGDGGRAEFVQGVAADHRMIVAP